MSKTLYPFDLEKALAGAPVCARNGSEASVLGRSDKITERQRVYGVQDGDLCSWDDEGMFYKDGTQSSLDLFMCDPPPLSPEMQLVKELAEIEPLMPNSIIGGIINRAKAITSAV